MIKLNSLSRKLALLVMLAVLPALIILLYSGIEQREHAIEHAQDSVFQLTHTMARTQQELTRSARQILSTLSLLSEIKNKNAGGTDKIFRSVLKQNPNYSNINLIDLNGDVIASGITLNDTNLSDQKHFIKALEANDFVIGEYITSSVGAGPALSFAYPVNDANGSPLAVLSMYVKLDSFSSFHDTSNLPENSFVAITDRSGIRLFYYPAKEATNPVGKPIKSMNWLRASGTDEPGVFINAGSDGLSRLFAFEQVRLTPTSLPYMYVWAGIPEAHIVGPANKALSINLMLLLMVTAISLTIAWLIGKSTDRLIIKLETALEEIKALRGIIPICSYCHSIRDDEGAWSEMEAYITSHSDVQFSHGVCPKCADKIRKEELQNKG